MMVLHQGIRNRRIGKWCWALSAEEGLTAAVVEASQRDHRPVSAMLKRRYAAMVSKQRKLLARANAARVVELTAPASDAAPPALGTPNDDWSDDEEVL